MALYNEILTGALSNILARRLGMQSGSPAPQLAPEVMPTLSLESDRPEWKFLGGEKLCAAATSSPAVAAQHSFIVLVNPTGSNLLGVVEQLVIVPGTSSYNVILATTTAFAGTPVSTTVRDRRWIQAGSTVASSGLTVTFGSIPVLTPEPSAIIGDASLVIQTPFILTPGSSLLISNNTQNQPIGRASLAWRERALVQGELVGG